MSHTKRQSQLARQQRAEGKARRDRKRQERNAPTSMSPAVRRRVSITIKPEVYANEVLDELESL